MVGGDESQGAEIQNEQGTLKTWGTALKTMGPWRVLIKDNFTMLFYKVQTHKRAREGLMW